MRISKAESKQALSKQNSNESIGKKGGKSLVENSVEDTFVGDLDAEFQDLPQFDKPQINSRRAIEILLEQRKLLRDELDDSFEYLN